MIEGFAIHGHVRPALGCGRIDGGDQRNPKRRVRAGNPIENLPDGPIFELDVEDRDFDLSVAQPAYGVVDPLRPKYRVVAGSEDFFKGIANHRIVFGDKNAHPMVLRVFRSPDK
jgi:hypothetical protein